MCRSIKTLRGNEPTTEEVRAAALQFVRKVSGYRAPSKANEAVFTAAVDEIEAAAERLLGGLVPPSVTESAKSEATGTSRC
jgi:hypothetical protein